MIKTLFPTTEVSGKIRVPGDKSVSHRALIFGAIAHGTTRIYGLLQSLDTQATRDCLISLGIDIRLADYPRHEIVSGYLNTEIVIVGNGWNGLQTPNRVLDCGNSGTTMRLLMGVLAGRPFESTLGGDSSLSKRPMDRVRVPLSQMGAQISGVGEKNVPPIAICGGNLNSTEYAMPIASAQVKSAILLAGLQAEGTTTVLEPAPSRDHTEQMLRAFGVAVEQNGNRVSVEGSQNLTATNVRVPGDISSAAFFFVAGALKKNFSVQILDVGLNPTRTGILDVLRAMGANIEIENQRVEGELLGDVTISGGDLKATHIGGNLIPRLIDELPVLALLATQCEGETVIRDAQEMRVKESDRIAVIASELRKLGANIEETLDGLTIHGPTKLKGATVTSPPGDHRIAMTLAVASLICDGETILENADAVTSSFPNFWELLAEVAR